MGRARVFCAPASANYSETREPATMLNQSCVQFSPHLSRIRIRVMIFSNFLLVPKCGLDIFPVGAGPFRGFTRCQTQGNTTVPSSDTEKLNTVTLKYCQMVPWRIVPGKSTIRELLFDFYDNEFRSLPEYGPKN